jgi:hypothetical protein
MRGVLSLPPDVCKINGTGHMVSYTELCTGLLVTGSGNRVYLHLTAGARIVVDGDDNTVTYQAPSPPQIQDRGTANLIVTGSSPF